MAPENLFAGAYLDRRADARLRDDWLVQARDDPDTLYLVMRQGSALVHPGGQDQPTRVALLRAGDAALPSVDDPARAVLLGWFHQQRVVLLEQDAAEPGPDVPPGTTFAELRPLAGELEPTEAGLVAYARALHLWRANHRHCGRCGAPTQPTRAGHALRCTACGHQGFPRLDPAVIVLVHDGEHALLGRQASWPPGRYSTIAGFVEPGESLEDAVRREVHEETGVAATEVRYHSSQPWPFPASLMLGFIARAAHDTPVLHDGELEDARWFTRAQVASGEIRLPPPEAISRRLIDTWLHHAQ